MRIIAIAALLAACLAGCASTPDHGNLLDTETAVNQERLAGDTIKQMVALWPPAKTRLEFLQPTPDTFGATLLKGLRERGYAVMEHSPKAPPANATPTTSATRTLSLRYTLDQAPGANQYRLTVTVGTQSITRLYQEQDGELLAGYWTRKE